MRLQCLESHYDCVHAGMHALHEIADELAKSGRKLALANPSRAMQVIMKRAKLLEHVGEVRARAP